MVRIYFAAVQDGVLVGDFARVADFDLAGDVDALKQRLKAWSADLAGIEPRHMTVFGPWVSTDAVPDDVSDATKGRGLAPNLALSSLVGATGDYFFIVRITAPHPAAAADDSAIRALIEEAAQAAAQRVIASFTLVDSFNPFARSHHSDDTSSVGVERALVDGAFKRRVAQWYGLESANHHELVDMLGITRPFNDVTLAHIYPASYTNFGQYASEMALPPDFNVNERNFLLLPRDLHVAFDAGHVAMIPRKDGVRMRVLRPDSVSPAIALLDGRDLYLPKAQLQPPRVPYKRVLGWMAWLARGNVQVNENVHAELEASLIASQSSEGNLKAQAMLARARECGKAAAHSVG